MQAASSRARGQALSRPPPTFGCVLFHVIISLMQCREALWGGRPDAVLDTPLLWARRRRDPLGFRCTGGAEDRAHCRQRRLQDLSCAQEPGQRRGPDGSHSQGRRLRRGEDRERQPKRDGTRCPRVRPGARPGRQRCCGPLLLCRPRCTGRWRQLPPTRQRPDREGSRSGGRGYQCRLCAAADAGRGQPAQHPHSRRLPRQSTTGRRAIRPARSGQNDGAERCGDLLLRRPKPKSERRHGRQQPLCPGSGPRDQVTRAAPC